MTRIENENQKDNLVKDLQGEIDKLKKGLKRKQNRRILGCGSCTIAFLVLAILISGFVSYFLAKSGMAHIPYISDMLYKEPRPTYIVQTMTNETQPDIFSALKESLENSLTTINNALNSKVNLQISDSQLTRIINDQVAQNNSLKSRIEYLQVAVLPQNLELFMKLKKPQNTYMVFEIIPKVNNNKIDLEVVSFKIGNLKIPNFIGDAIIAPIAEQVLNLVIKPFVAFGKIQEIRLDYGKVLVGVVITNLQGLF